MAAPTRPVRDLFVTRSNRPVELGGRQYPSGTPADDDRRKWFAEEIDALEGSIVSARYSINCLDLFCGGVQIADQTGYVGPTLSPSVLPDPLTLGTFIATTAFDITGTAVYRADGQTILDVDRNLTLENPGSTAVVEFVGGYEVFRIRQTPDEGTGAVELLIGGGDCGIRVADSPGNELLLMAGGPDIALVEETATARLEMSSSTTASGHYLRLRLLGGSPETTLYARDRFSIQSSGQYVLSASVEPGDEYLKLDDPVDGNLFSAAPAGGDMVAVVRNSPGHECRLLDGGTPTIALERSGGTELASLNVGSSAATHFLRLAETAAGETGDYKRDGWLIEDSTSRLFADRDSQEIRAGQHPDEGTGYARISGGGGDAGFYCQDDGASNTVQIMEGYGPVVRINGTQVLTTQQTAVANATGSSDAYLRLNELLARLRTHGIIDT